MQVLDQCRDMYGSLSKSNRTLLAAALQGMDKPLWLQVKRVVISNRPIMTLEMAIKQVTNKTITGIPDPFTVYRALRYAIDRQTHRKKQAPIASS